MQVFRYLSVSVAIHIAYYTLHMCGTTVPYTMNQSESPAPGRVVHVRL